MAAAAGTEEQAGEFFVSLDGRGTATQLAPAPATVEETARSMGPLGNACVLKPYGWGLLNTAPVALRGEVLGGHNATEDVTLVHNAADYNFFVYPDFQLEHLLSSPGNFHGGDAYEAGRMEVEWEQAGASSAGGIPAWAYPQQGDRIYTIGSHVADCGHGFELNPITSSTYRAEIHPPRCVAVFRNAALSEFAGGVGRLGSTYQRQWATRVDVSASSYGGPALTNAGAPSEYQAMNGQDITFDVHAPPRPSFDATLKIAYIDRGEQGGDVTAEAIGKIDSSETDASKVKVHFQGNPHKVQPETAAKTVYLYWTGGPSQVKPHVRNYTVTVLSVTTQDMLGALPGPSLLSFYGYVNTRRRAATPHRLPRHLTNSSHPGDCAHRRDGRGDLYRRRIRPTAVPLAGPNRARFVATNWVGAADDLRAYSTMAIGDQAVDATCLGPCFTVRYEIDPM